MQEHVNNRYNLELQQQQKIILTNFIIIVLLFCLGIFFFSFSSFAQFSFIDHSAASTATVHCI